MVVSPAPVVVQSAGGSVAGWWLGGAVGVGRLAGPVLWGSAFAARAGGSMDRCLRGCPPLGPVLWSRALWGFLPLGLGAVAGPSSYSGACEVALAVAGVVACRWGRGGGLCGGVPGVFLCGCSPFSPCGCALIPLCGFRRLVGVSRCCPYGVRFVFRRRMLGACTSRGQALSAGGGAVLVPPLWHAVPACAPWCPPLCPLCLRHGPCSFLFLAHWWFPAPVLCRSRCPVPVGACLSPWALAGVSLPVPCSLPARAFSFPGVVVVGWGGGLLGTDGPHPGSGCLEPLGEGLGGVGRANVLDRVPEEGFPCRLRHGGLRGGLVGVGGGAGADLLEGSHPFSPSRPPDPLHPVAEFPQGGGRKRGEVGGGLGGGEGSELEVQVGVVDMGWRWPAWRRLGEREGRWRGTGSLVLLAGGGGCRHGTALACLAAPGGAGAVVVGAWGGERVRAAGRTGRSMGLVGGEGRGHGTAVACVVAPGGAGAAGMSG